MIKIVHQAHPGHFCGASRCLFRLNTAIEDSLSGRAVIISTVGDYYVNDNDGKPEEIGLGRAYETMVFNARRNEEGRQCCPFDVSSFADTLESDAYNNSDEAFRGHSKLVKRWTKLLRTRP